MENLHICVKVSTNEDDWFEEILRFTIYEFFWG